MHSSLRWYSVADTWAQNNEALYLTLWGARGVEKVNIPANSPIAFLDEVKDMEKTMKKVGATFFDMTPLFDLSNVASTIPTSFILVRVPSTISSISRLLHHEHRRTCQRPCKWERTSTPAYATSHDAWAYCRCHRGIRRHHFFPLLCLCWNSVRLLHRTPCSAKTAILPTSVIPERKSLTHPECVLEDTRRRWKEMLIAGALLQSRKHIFKHQYRQYSHYASCAKEPFRITIHKPELRFLARRQCMGLLPNQRGLVQSCRERLVPEKTPTRVPVFLKNANLSR